MSDGGIPMLRMAVVAGIVAVGLFLQGGVGLGAEKKTTPAQDIIGKDGAPMMSIPTGEFLMGSSSTTIEEWSKIDDCGPNKQCSLDDEFPQHPVMVDVFVIDKFEVTNARYLKFVQATKHRLPVNPNNAQDKSRNVWEGD